MTQQRILGISNSPAVFVPSWQDPAYIKLMLELSGKENPTICYVGAANGDDPRRLADFFDICNRVGCHGVALRLFNMTTSQSEQYFADADIILFDGGATRNLLALMREWQAIEPLIAAYERGVLIAGASAGISMLFDWCITDSIKTEIVPAKGIGLLKGTFCAHYDAREERRVALAELIASNPESMPAYGLDDGMAVLFVNGVLQKSYTVTRDANLHMITGSANDIKHQIKPAEIVITNTGAARSCSSTSPTSVL